MSLGTYLALLVVLAATGAAHLGTTVLLYGVGERCTTRPVWVRLLILLPFFALFTATAFAHVIVPLSIESLRLFLKSGWTPRIWWGVCLFATAAPAVTFQIRRDPFRRAR